MRSACLAFVAGAWWLQQQPELLDATFRRWVGESAWTIAARPMSSMTLVVMAFVAVFVVVTVAVFVVFVFVPRSVALWVASSARRRGAASPLARDDATAPPAVACDARTRVVRMVRRMLLVAAVFVAGFGWATWRAQLRLAESLPHVLEGRDIVVVGTVAALPGSDARGVRFPFTVESVAGRDPDGRVLVVPSHLSLGWYRPRHGDAIDGGSVPDIRPGQRWRLTVRLKRPHGSANPFGFDYEYWLLEEGLRATGSVRPGTDIDADASDENLPSADPPASTRKLDEFVWSAGHVVERTRALLRDRVVAALSNGRPLAESAPYAGVIVALIVGDQRAISQSDWIVFNRTGIGHLVSISGLHVSMLAALGAWIVFAWWRRHPAWCARLPGSQR